MKKYSYVGIDISKKIIGSCNFWRPYLLAERIESDQGVKWQDAPDGIMTWLKLKSQQPEMSREGNFFWIILNAVNFKQISRTFSVIRRDVPYVMRIICLFD